MGRRRGGGSIILEVTMSEITTEQLQTIVAQQARELDQVRVREQQAVVDGAIGAAIDNSGIPLASGAARQQLAELLRGEVSLINHGGQLVPAGPGLVPVAQHVKARLAQPEYQHFTASRPVAGQPGGLVPSPGDPEKSLGVRMIEHAQAQRAAQQAPGRSPATDMSQRFGLGFPTSR
jgi:hypothetical protein